MRIAVCEVLVLSLGFLWSAGTHAAPVAPAFVGCPADGQSGPVPAPSVPPASPRIPRGHSGQLAVYAAAGMTVLAPRGWHCIETYGSGGAALLVTPHPYTAATLPRMNALAGPAVEASFINGEDSGRDQVAELLARLFPRRQRFIRETAATVRPAHHYPGGLFPSDRIVRRSQGEVGYTTSPHRRGTGTVASYMSPDADAIEGTATLARSNGIDSVLLVNVRLPLRLRALAADILDAGAQSPPAAAPSPAVDASPSSTPKHARLAELRGSEAA